MSTSPEELTPEESILITKHLRFYTALAEGVRAETTAQQERFVAVCKGTATAKTAHEVAFLKFREQRAAKERQAALERAAEERQAALDRQREYQKKLADYQARQNSSLLETDVDRWW